MNQDIGIAHQEMTLPEVRTAILGVARALREGHSAGMARRLELLERHLDSRPHLGRIGASPPLARTGDPSTSHEAARTVNVTSRQRECFNTMNTRPDYCWGAWEVDLVAGTTGLWKRMNELLRAGWVTKVGQKRGPHGKPVETFRVALESERRS